MQWLVIHLVSITVAGAAPGLDESAPDFPYYPFPRGTGTSRRAKPASSRGASSRQFMAPRRVASSPAVKPLENDTAPGRVAPAAELLGYLAVAPLIVCLACEAALPGLRRARARTARRDRLGRRAARLTRARCTGDWRSPGGMAGDARCAWRPRRAAGLVAAAAVLLGGQRGTRAARRRLRAASGCTSTASLGSAAAGAPTSACGDS